MKNIAAFSLAGCLLAALVASPLLAQGKDKAGAKQDKPTRPIGGAVAMVQGAFSAPIRECSVSKDGSVAVICTEDGYVHFTKLDNHFGGDLTKAGQGDSVFRYQIQDAFLSRTGERLIGRVNASTVAIVTKKPKVLHLLRGMPGLVVTALHPDGVQFAGGMRGGLIRTWDTNTGKSLSYLSMFIDKKFTWIGFSPDGKSMIAATDDKRLWYFSYPGGEKQQEVEVDSPITHLAFAADGATMVSHAGNKVHVWEVVAAKAKSSFDTGTPVVCTALSADGKTIAVAHDDGTVVLHDGATGKLTFGWEAHPGLEIICLQFIKPKAGKHMLVTAAKKGDVVYWDVSKLKAPEPDKKGKGKKGKKKG